MARRLLTVVGVFVGLLVAALVAGAAYAALKAQLSTDPNSNITTVKFQNSSAATHASPEDLHLIDSGRRSSIPTTDAGCKTFARTEFSDGKTFGPIDICFRVANSTPPFILHWTPDIGAFCCERDLTIWPT